MNEEYAKISKNKISLVVRIPSAFIYKDENKSGIRVGDYLKFSTDKDNQVKIDHVKEGAASGHTKKNPKDIRTANKEKVTHILLKEPRGMSTNDIAKASGLNWRTALEILTELKREDQITRTNKPIKKNSKDLDGPYKIIWTPKRN
jgi:hypothetical protein